MNDHQKAKNFLVKYFENFDIEYWEELAEAYSKEFDEISKPHVFERFSIKAYTSYIQFLEIAFSNLLIFAGRAPFLWGMMGVGTKTFQKIIRRHIVNGDLVDFILDKLVFGINEKSAITNYDEKAKFYREIILECADELLNDYELLNAFKHCFWIQASHDKEDFIKFSSFRRVKKQIFLQERTVNITKVAIKMKYIVGMLKNARTVFLSQENGTQGVILDLYSIENKSLWEELKVTSMDQKRIHEVDNDSSTLFDQILK